MAPGAMNQRQIDSLVALLRCAAHGEQLSEQMRCRLGECHDFEPYEVFQVLQGGRQSQRGSLGTYGLHRWLQTQPLGLSTARIEDVASMLVPYEGQHGEIRYDGFLNMVLPKDPNHAWLKESVLARGCRASWNLGATESQIAPEVAYRLCQLFENEMDVARQLKFHRKNLVELGIGLSSLCKFLDKEQGVCAGMGGLLSPSSLRHTLVDDLKALTPVQCDALLQRINPSGACLAPFHELAKVLSLGPPWPVANAWRGRDFKDRLDRSWDNALSLSTTSLASPPASRESSWLSSPTRVLYDEDPLSPRREAWSDPLSRSVGNWRSPPLEMSTVTPRHIPAETMSAGRSHSPSSWRPHPVEISPSRSVPTETMPVGRSRSLGTWRSPPLEIPPTRSVPTEPMATGRHLGVGDLLSLTQESKLGKDLFGDARFPSSPGLASTQASTADFLSPRSPISRASPPSVRGRPWSANAPLRDLGLTKRPSSSPASPDHSNLLRSTRSLFPMDASIRSDSPRNGYRSLPSEMGTSYFENLQAQKSVDRRGSVLAVLQAVVQQAELDAKVEDGKSFVSFDAPLSEIFDAMDRFRKGYISDTDMWSFAQQHGGQSSFGSLCALVHEVQLRRPRDLDSVSGRLSFREFASLILPVGSQEHEAISGAATEDEARSIDYLIRNSNPCPGCGVRVQRDADCAGCPTVTCPMCRTSFQCFMVSSDYYQRGLPLSVAVLYQLQRLLSIAATAAYELEGARKRLALLPGGDAVCMMSAVFTHFSEGRLSISIDDLHHQFRRHQIDISMQELAMLRHRFARKGSSDVTFAEFVRQLTPRASF